MDINNVLKKIDNQEWRQHPVLKNVECSELGLIKLNGKLRKGCISNFSKKGGKRKKLLYCRIEVNGKFYLLHRLIYECFNGLIPNGLQIDHINTITLDNRIENLRAVSSLDNNRNPITVKHKMEALLKRKDKREKPVLQRDKRTGEIVGYYESLRQACKETGADRKSVRNVCNGKTGCNSASGYKWEWAKYRYSCKWGKWWITD